jgi:hypothetical protein
MLHRELAPSSPCVDVQLEKFERLSALAADFQHTAKTCGKIIISEKNLPNEFKTIRTSPLFRRGT